MRVEEIEHLAVHLTFFDLTFCWQWQQQEREMPSFRLS
jgi:hypothetical protein